MVPFEAGRRLAAATPNARFLPLEGKNHILRADEPDGVTAPPPTGQRPAEPAPRSCSTGGAILAGSRHAGLF
jgi:hypothetical protein